jgi:hypothetical protein
MRLLCEGGSRTQLFDLCWGLGDLSASDTDGSNPRPHQKRGSEN